MAYTDYRLSITGSANKIYIKVSELKVLMGLPVDDVVVATQEDLQTLLELIESQSPEEIDLSLYVTQEQLTSLTTNLVSLTSLVDIQIERIQTLEDNLSKLQSGVNTQELDLQQAKQNINILNTNQKEMREDIDFVAQSIPSLDYLVGSLVTVDSGLITVGNLKVYISESVSDNNGGFTADYSDANFNQVLFQSSTAYADTNYTTTGASNFASLYKETETLKSIQGVVKGAEGVGLLVGTVLVNKKNARVKTITVGL